MDIGGGANPSIVSLKQGSRGHTEAMGYLILLSTKIPYNPRLVCFQAKFQAN